jgi:16S rRNA (cytosine967-C5)-methyltransferase
VDLLLARPLPERDAEIHDLLAVGLYQLEDTRVPDHAAVAATVEAARQLGRGQYAGLVNACLRRWLREREALKARVARVPEVVHAHPRWWLDALAADWPKDWEAIVAAANEPGADVGQGQPAAHTRDAWLTRLIAAGGAATTWDPAPEALVSGGADGRRVPAGFQRWRRFGPGCRRAAGRGAACSRAPACACWMPAPRRAARLATCWSRARRSS